MCSFFSFKKTAAAAVAALILPFTHAASDDASPRSGVVIFGQMDIGSAGSKTERGLFPSRFQAWLLVKARAQ